MKISPTISGHMPVAVCTCLAVYVCWGEVEMITLDGMNGVFTLFFANCLVCLDTSTLIVNEEYTVLWSIVHLSRCAMGLNVETEVFRVLCICPAGTNRSSIVSIISCRAFRKTAAQLGFCSLFHCRGNIFVGSSSFYKYDFFKKEREGVSGHAKCVFL
jgi:hypothetical protein